MFVKEVLIFGLLASSFVCHGSKSSNDPSVLVNWQVCGAWDIYNPATHKCCAGKIAVKVSTNAECCWQATRDPETQVCCGFRVSPKPGPNDICCADHEPEKCCTGTLQRKPSDNAQCCVRQAYDPAVNRCIGGYVV